MELRLKIIYSDFMDEITKNDILRKIEEHLDKQGISLLECHIEYDGILILTGGTEQAVANEINQQVLDKIILFTHRGNNSLAAALEISASFQRQNRSVKIIDLEAGEIDFDTNQNNLSEQKAKSSLLGYRLGVIGKPSNWLIASTYSAEVLQRRWGIELQKVEIAYLRELISKHLSDSDSKEVRQYSGEVREPDGQDLLNSQAVYLALKEIITEYELDALTIRCFDLVVEDKMTACYALGRLNASNFPAGCEGDIASITGMMWAKKVHDKIPWMANPVRIDRERSVITLAHCTAPLSDLENVVMRSHFESGLGVGIQGKLKYDEVTLFRLGGEYLEDIWAAEGRVTGHLQEENLCRTQLEISLDAGDLKALIDKPLGNHLLVLSGRYKKEILATDFTDLHG
ncbi:MAG: hypothetical protein K9M99_07070 [Candidatus Cloacimonetes bacterium]|nr:hypothetical protein [Candidatus Cloacimonadota bacterium]